MDAAVAREAAHARDDLHPSDSATRPESPSPIVHAYDIHNHHSSMLKVQHQRRVKRMSSVGASRKPGYYAVPTPRLLAEPSYGWYEHQLRDTMIERRVVRQGSEPEQYRYGTVHRVVALRGLGNSAELSEAITATHSDPLGRIRTWQTRIVIRVGSSLMLCYPLSSPEHHLGQRFRRRSTAQGH